MDHFEALAVARPRLNIEFFDTFYPLLAQCRNSLHEALEMFKPTGKPRPEQTRVIAYSVDFMMAQAHRIVLWRCSEEQLQRASTAATAQPGKDVENIETYKMKLQMLRSRSTEEAFQAARRIMKVISAIFEPHDQGTAEFFVPGYFIYEGLLVWTSLLLDTKTMEEGGRIDYSLSDKLEDLRALREAIAVSGWSSGLVGPHLKQLNQIIIELEKRQLTITAPSNTAYASFFPEFIDMSPSAGLPIPACMPSSSYRETSNSTSDSLPQHSTIPLHSHIAQHSSQLQPAQPSFDFTAINHDMPKFQEISPDVSPPIQTPSSSESGFAFNHVSSAQDAANIPQYFQSDQSNDQYWQNGGLEANMYAHMPQVQDPSSAFTEPLPNSEYVDQFLRSIGFKM
jgi:hypothetical protein